MRLPDREASRALLVGTSTYAANSGFDSLPSVTANLAEFARVLRNRTGLGDRQLRVVADPADSAVFIDALEPMVDEAQDLLLFYFAGHGVALPDNDLGMTHCGSKIENPAWHTVQYKLVREEMARSRAKVKMVILDCCHSGYAFGQGTMASSDQNDALRDLAAIEGSYVLTATNRKSVFAASSGPGGCTAFTGHLVDLLWRGSEFCGEYLAMDDVFKGLRDRLKASNLPLPQASGGNTASALALTRNYFHVRQESRTPQQLYLEAEAAQENGQLGEAERWYRAAAEAGESRAMATLGTVLWRRGEWAEAERWYRQAAVAGEPRGMANLGTMLERKDQLGEAERWYRAAAMDSQPRGMANLGWVLARRGELEDAEKWCRRAAEDGDPRGMNNVGLLCDLRGNMTEAAQWYARAADCGEPLAVLNMGLVFDRQGRPADAAACYHRALEAGETIGMVNLGSVLERSGQMGQAEQWYRRAAEAGLPLGMTNLGHVLELRGRMGDAEQWYRRAAEAGERTGMSNLGYVLDRWGQLTEAEQWYRRAADAGEPLGMSNLGFVLERQGQLNEAEQWYRRAALAGEPQGMTNLAIALEARGQHREAGEWRRRAEQPRGMRISFDPNYVVNPPGVI